MHESKVSHGLFILIGRLSNASWIFVTSYMMIFCIISAYQLWNNKSLKK